MKEKITIPVLTAIKRLSAVCDGAIEKDGSGFNKPDSHFFKSISWVSCLTISEQIDYKERLYKYKHQLGVDDLTVVDYGIPDDKIATKQASEIREYELRKLEKSVKFLNGKMILSFGYNQEMIQAVKNMRERRFDWNDKVWVVTVDKQDVEEVKRLLDEYYFQYDEAEFIAKYTGDNKKESGIKATLVNDKLSFSFQYDPKTVAEVKTIPGRRFDPITKSWVVTVNEGSCLYVKRFMEMFGVESPEGLEEKMSGILVIAAEKEGKMIQNLEASASMEAELEVPGFKGTLRPFQKAGVRYIIANKKVIVGDEMGLGKTIEAIAAMEHENAYPALISCPNSLKHNWKSECDRFLDRKSVVINANTGLSVVEGRVDIYIMNYNTMAKFAEELKGMGFKTLVSDESHYLKNKDAQRTKAFTTLVNDCKPEMTMLLTGTVIVNRPNELISPLNILDKLKEFGGFWRFVNRYCDAHRNSYGLDISGASNLEELHRKLRALCYIRRNKKDVLTELPDKTRQTIQVDITNRAKYERAKEDVINFLRNEAEEDKKFRDSLEGIESGLKSDLYDFMKRFGIDSIQFKNHELTKEEALKAYREAKAKSAEQAEHLVKINELKKLVAEGKLEESIDWIRDMIDSGEKLVLFCTHVKMVDAIAKEFKCNKIDGSIKAEDRFTYVQDFQNNPDTRLIVLNLAAGKEGLTLTAASKLAFLEMGWTPGEHDQAEDRIHRIGQKYPVNIYYLVGVNTIDQDIFELIEKKRVVTNAVNKGENVDTRQEGILSELIGRLIS